MAVTLKIKRRASTGNAGAPSALKSGELAFNENTGDKLLYYGYGDDGSGNATSIVSIGGEQIPNSGLANSSVTINSNSLSLGGSLTLDSDDIGEGASNLYFTNARSRGAISASGGIAYNSSTGALSLSNISNSELANSSLTLNSNSVSLGGSLTLDTDDIGEGSTNLYYTDARSRSALSASGGVTYNSTTGALSLANIANSELANSGITLNSNSVSLGGSLTLDTDDIGEGATNLYYTDARSRSALSASGGITYNSSTGAFGLSSIPNTALANSSITINGVATPLGGSTTTTTVTGSLGTTITFQGTAGEVEVATNNSTSTFTIGLPDSVQITDDLSVGGDITVTGDLTVNGALTSLSTTEVKVEDKNIVLGDTATPTDTTADGGGITLKGASDYTITWVNATNSWTFNQALNVTSGGIKMGGTEVLSSSRVLSNTAITGSGNTIDNVTIDGGTF